MRNPFEDDIFSGSASVTGVGRGGVPSIHGEVLGRLARRIGSASGEGFEVVPGSRGKAILVSAPRAGFGKSHLLSRVAATLGREAVVVDVRFNLEEHPDWDTLLRQTLARFALRELGNGQSAPIQTLARWLFATLTARLIESGDVPSANPETAVAGLRENAQRLFDPHHGDQSVLDWMTNNFEQLRPPMARVLARARRLTESGGAFWLDAFREANECPVPELGEFLGGLVPAPGPSGGDARIARFRLADFCRCASAHRPLVFVVDHLDCFHGDTRAGLRIAYLLSELHAFSPGIIVLLAVNDDLWRSTFGEHLPGALEDRLHALPERLGALSPDEARHLIHTRCEDAAVPAETRDQFLDAFEIGSGESLAPRAILRRARAAWDQFAEAGDARVPPPPSVAEGFPGGLLGDFDFGADIPSVAELMDAETLRRTRVATPPEVSPFLSDPPDADEGGPQTLRTFLEAPAPVPAGRDFLEGPQAPLRKAGRAGIPTPVPRPLRQPPDIGPDRDGSPAAHPLVVAFHARRDALVEGAPVTLDLARLHRLVALCGIHSPIVECSELPYGASGAGKVLRWAYPDSEILIAFPGPDADPAFWDSFLDLPADGHAGAKLVAFSSGDGTQGLPVLPAMPFGIPPMLDVIPIPPATAASLRAASELVEDADAIGPATPAEALGALADELDFFWRRLTRDLAAGPVGDAG